MLLILKIDRDIGMSIWRTDLFYFLVVVMNCGITYNHLCSKFLLFWLPTGICGIRLCDQNLFFKCKLSLLNRYPAANQNQSIQLDYSIIENTSWLINTNDFLEVLKYITNRDVPIRFFWGSIRFWVIWFWVSLNIVSRSDTFVTDLKNEQVFTSLNFFYHLKVINHVMGSLVTWSKLFLRSSIVWS